MRFVRALQIAVSDTQTKSAAVLMKQHRPPALRRQERMNPCFEMCGGVLTSPIMQNEATKYLCLQHRVELVKFSQLQTNRTPADSHYAHMDTGLVLATAWRRKDCECGMKKIRAKDILVGDCIATATRPRVERIEHTEGQVIVYTAERTFRYTPMDGVGVERSPSPQQLDRLATIGRTAKVEGGR